MAGSNVSTFGRRKAPKAFLKITLDREFSTFGEDKREAFLSDLGEVLGLAPGDFSRVSWSPGCVIFRAKVDHSAVARALELWRRHKEKQERGETDEAAAELVQAFGEVIEAWGLKEVEQYREAHEFSISARRRPKDGVIFVHGFTGGPETFGKFPQLLAEELDIRPLVYTFPSSFRGNNPSLSHIALHLLNYIQSYTETENTGVIVHSMGGLVLQKALVTDEVVRPLHLSATL